VGSPGIQFPITTRPPGRVTRNHRLGHIEWPGREHRPEDADDEIEAPVLESAQIRRVALLEPAVVEAELLRSRISGGDEVAGDIDAQDIGPELGRRNRCGAVTATEIQHPHPLADVQIADERLSTLPHGRRDASEVALLPQRLVRIHHALSPVDLGDGPRRSPGRP
jgi:hypothetical protein